MEISVTQVDSGNRAQYIYSSEWLVKVFLCAVYNENILVNEQSEEST